MAFKTIPGALIAGPIPNDLLLPVLAYSGPPALGNLTASMSATSGTDVYGNHYDPGIVSYDNVFGGVTQINGADVELFDGTSLFFDLNPHRLLVYNSFGGGLGNLLVSIATQSGSDQYGNNYLQGVATYTGTVSTIQLDPADARVILYGSTGAAFGCQLANGGGAGTLLGGESTAALPDAANMYLIPGASSGAQQIVADSIYVREPGNLTTPYVPEVWHNLGAIAAAWTNGGFARYKALVDSDLILVEFQALTSPAAAPADGSVVWSAANGLPANYRPGNNSRRPLQTTKLGAAGVGFAFLNTGEIDIFGLSATVSARIDGSCLLSTV